MFAAKLSHLDRSHQKFAADPAKHVVTHLFEKPETVILVILIQCLAVQATTPVSLGHYPP